MFECPLSRLIYTREERNERVKEREREKRKKTESKKGDQTLNKI